MSRIKRNDSTLAKDTKTIPEKHNSKSTKKIVKRNQFVIGALTVLLGVAGYINFSSEDINLSKDKLATKAEPATEEAFAEAELTAGEVTFYELEEGENIELNSDEENIGEAVLTSADVVSVSVSGIKFNREQERSKNKELYLEIINGDGMDAAAVENATNAYLAMAENMEKEADAETILQAKGFTNVIVSISTSENDENKAVDVVVGGDDLSDADRAQIEDVVTRKCGCTVDQIVITTVSQ